MQDYTADGKVARGRMLGEVFEKRMREIEEKETQERAEGEKSDSGQPGKIAVVEDRAGLSPAMKRAIAEQLPVPAGVVRRVISTLPREGTRFQINGLTYTVTYVNEGKGRFTCELVRGEKGKEE